MAAGYGTDWKNQLYFGDNLPVLREYVKDETVDLVYLDPPFNSKADYNVLYKEHSGQSSEAQITAFEDTWHWDSHSEAIYQETVTTGPEKLSKLLQAYRQFLGENDMMAYLAMMAPRLVELHRVLKPTGSLYLHCDPTASHYIKLLLDAVFGPRFFRTEVVWRRAKAKGLAFNRMANNHDVIFYYSKSESIVWNRPFRSLDEGYVENSYRYVEPETGRRYRLDNCNNPNRNRPNLTYEWNGVTRVWRWTREKMQQLHDEGRLIYSRTGMAAYKRYLDETQGAPVDSVWEDIEPIGSHAAERLGYPTQKPEALLERILKASSNEGDLVLDPFCGCGTTIAVAERLNRRWIGIDITHLAIALMKVRLKDTFGDDLRPYEVHGEPIDLAGARALFEEDRYQFQYWALGLVDARPTGAQKKGADKGIDGLKYFFVDESGKPEKIVLQVKGGHVNRGVIATLKGDMEREGAAIGALITLESPTDPMVKEAAAAGFYTDPLTKKQYEKVQILTIEELLSGHKRLEYPPHLDATFLKAKRVRSDPGQGKLEI